MRQVIENVNFLVDLFPLVVMSLIIVRIVDPNDKHTKARLKCKHDDYKHPSQPNKERLASLIMPHEDLKHACKAQQVHRQRVE